ncbi:MAG: hypothetical protein IJ451_01775 [Ruminococcus sp.]|nr:hypothetical protein [Ruminococcus sp.]
MKNTIKRTAKSVVKGVYFIMPFAIAGGVLVSLSYVIDLILGGDAIYGLGSENPVAVLLKSLGTLTFSLMLPVLASAIATDVSDKGAFAAGLVGGYLAQNGATLMLPYGDTTAVSGFIGAILAGIVAGIIYKGLKMLFTERKVTVSHISKNLILPLGSVLATGIFMLSINPLVGLLNTGVSAMLMIISEANPVAFGAILGLMTAIDIGGAFSKAAFIFATAAIASGEYTAMAAVMSAGMTVPLSIALSSMIFRVKFSKKEAELAKANMIFGLFNITEGAIPIAAKNPTRVLPSCALGAVVSGALSAGFGCTLIAPYGGLLIIPLIGRPVLFVISVFTGTLLGAVMLGIFKKEPKTNFNEAVKIEIEK